MTTAVPLTLYLLVLIGLYELTAGIAGLTGALDWPKMLDEYERSPALTFVTGFAAFAIGAAIHLAHRHWTDLPAIIVSAIGLIAIAEGLLLMAVPRPLLAVSRDLVRNQKAISIVAALFGAALILLGLTGRAIYTALI
jgi:protein-S-isoprenylcysteine O-methyltransferase Ste14